MKAGFDDALTIVQSASTQLGTALRSTGWRRGNPGAYGYNYLWRAATNLMGLGANIVEECQAFNCFRDPTGERLDGSSGSYRVHFTSPPPADAFWSLTLYDATTRELHPNELGRYAIGDRTEDLRIESDGSITIAAQHHAPTDDTNWLPAPNGPFYLIVRAYLPKPELVRGEWQPPPVHRVETTVSARAASRTKR